MVGIPRVLPMVGIPRVVYRRVYLRWCIGGYITGCIREAMLVYPGCVGEAMLGVHLPVCTRVGMLGVHLPVYTRVYIPGYTMLSSLS